MSPHLNGTVERFQQTGLVELHFTVDIEAPLLPERIEEWQFFYIGHHPHSALGGKTAMKRCHELLEATFRQEDVEHQYQLKQQ